MGRSCAVIKCNSSGRMPARKFFRFPMLSKRSTKALALTQARQNAWLTALNRADFFPSHYQYASVCDLHFVSGKSAEYTDVENVDWVPTLNLGYGYQIKKECDEQVEPIEQVYLPEELFDEDVNSKETQGFTKCSVSTQTDDRYTGLSPDIVVAYQERITFLEEMLNRNVALDPLK